MEAAGEKLENRYNPPGFQPFLQPVDNTVLKHALGASPVELGAANNASGISAALISPPLGWMRDRYSIRKIYVVGVGLSALISLQVRSGNS